MGDALDEPAGEDDRSHLAWIAVPPDDWVPPEPMHGTWGGGKPPERRTIRFFAGWSDWPLWESSVGDWSPGYAMSPDDYGLSEALAQRMRSWQNAIERELTDNDFRRPSPEFTAASHAEALEIVRLLAEEVADFADVQFKG